MVYFYIFVWLINLILLLFKKKNKVVILGSIIFLIVLFFWSNGSGDYQNNKDVYEYHIQFEQLELGYTTLIKIFNSLSIGFQQFQGIICSTCFIITLLVFSRFSKNYHLFFSVYLIYQCLYDMDTMKNFIARALFFVAIYHILKGQRIKYVIFVLFAFLFHRTFILYFPLAFLNLKKLRISTVKVFVISIVLLVFIFWTISLFPSGFTLFTYIPIIGNFSEKMETYFSSSSKITFIIYFALHLLNIYYLCINKKVFMTNLKDKYMFNVFLTFNLYVLISFPFIIISNVFFRVFNNIYLLNYIMYAVSLERINRRKFIKNVIKIMIFNSIYRIPIVHSSAEFGRVFDLKQH